MKRKQGSPVWMYLASSQRWLDGMVCCALCGDPWPEYLIRHLEWDHIDPRGPSTLRNAQLTCTTCNKAKGERPQAEALVYIAEVRGLSRYERQRATSALYEQRPDVKIKNRDRMRRKRSSDREKYNESNRKNWHAGRARNIARLRERRRSYWGSPGGNARLF